MIRIGMGTPHASPIEANIIENEIDTFRNHDLSRTNNSAFPHAFQVRQQGNETKEK